MNIPVTGEDGFIGSHVAERWLSPGHDVTVLVSVPARKRFFRSVGEFTVLLLSERIIHKNKSCSKIVYVDPRPGDDRDSLSANRPVEDRLGYLPQYRLSDGLHTAMERHRKHLIAG